MTLVLMGGLFHWEVVVFNKDKSDSWKKKSYTSLFKNI